MLVRHTPITEINGIGNKIDIKAEIVSKYKNSEGEYITPTVELKFKVNDKAVKLATVGIVEKSPTVYTVTAAISADDLGDAGELLYAFKVYNGSTTTYFPSSLKADSYEASSTTLFQKAIITVSKTETIVGSTGGTIRFESGNNEIENLRMIIPQDAFTSASLSITLIQKKPVEVREISARELPVFVYDFSVAGQEHAKFSKPITVKLAYPDEDGDDNVNILGNNYPAKNLRVFYWNGSAWQMIGGAVDLKNKTITFQTSHFSLFAILYTNLTKNSFRPKGRIITPNGDGYNDEIIFPNLETDLPTIKIFDVNGRSVREISSIPYKWDGKDNTGRVVESGVYIYQFRASIDGKDEFVSGTIAVAK